VAVTGCPKMQVDHRRGDQQTRTHDEDGAGRRSSLSSPRSHDPRWNIAVDSQVSPSHDSPAEITNSTGVGRSRHA
jgi:hypothetical protein